jgi:hypothetical protein
LIAFEGKAGIVWPEDFVIGEDDRKRPLFHKCVMCKTGIRKRWMLLSVKGWPEGSQTMKDTENVKVGDLVLWSGEWGNADARPARVLEIVRTQELHEKTGECVESLPWSGVARSIVSLDNERWSYGDCLKKFSGPEPEDYQPMPVEPIRGTRKSSLRERLLSFGRDL